MLRSCNRLHLTIGRGGTLVAALSLTAVAAIPALAASGTFLGHLHKIRRIASTVPANGDVNPYGVAVIRTTMGRLVAGDVLVSNFNDRKNQQGTGRTIVEISPRSGRRRVFASLNPHKLPGACPGGIGLSTALVTLRSGWVIVGSLPTKNGSSSTARAGCLVVINPSGRAVETISKRPINGPWDMTAVDHGSTATLFVSNVLNGTVKASPKIVRRGTIVRIRLSMLNAHQPKVTSEVVVGKRLPERTDPAALVVGPTGLGLSHGTLFVADSARNAVDEIRHAMTRRTAATPSTITRGRAVQDPLGLAIAPNDDILAVNGANGNVVEITRGGRQVAKRTLDNTPVTGLPNGNGTLFGLAVAPDRQAVYFVDDGSNTLNVLR